MRKEANVKGAAIRVVWAVAAAAGLCLGSPAVFAANGDGAQAGQDTSSAIVQLSGDPLSTYVKTHPAQGKKIDFNSAPVKSYRAQLSALRNQYKQWLHANVPQAKVTAEFDIALNAVAVQLNGATLQQISATPLVVDAEYEGVYQPTGAVDPDLALIHAVDAWGAGGAPGAGAGVKVAIVDTGIDITHPCFSDTGYASQKQLGNNKFTNNKVIAAKVFNNKTPTQNYTPEALQDHGTHVSGTVGCNFDTPASVDGVVIPYHISGVAPSALLGNYNVFPGAVLNARDEDIFTALETAYSDGFDVANMSLGGAQKANARQDLLMAAVDNLDKANMIVAIAAGNDGPGFGTIESPGAAARALTAGASSVPHFVGAPVTNAANTYAALPGDFNLVSADLTAALAVVTGTMNGLNTACSALPANSLTGKIALISRGGCTFTAKITNAQAAGAVAVLVANSRPGDPIEMGTDGTPNQPTAPAYMVSLSDGQTLLNASGATTISATLAYFLTPNANFMADFSSQGPTNNDFRVKPDVVAPGVHVLSSIPHQFCANPPCFAFFNGTSMATPHLAGGAAVVRGQHPDWSAAEVRSAIVNTADRNVLKNFATAALETDENVMGAGRENLLSAVGAQAALDPVSVSFGAVPSGSGQTKPFDVMVTNLGSATATWNVAVTGGDASVAYDVTPKSVTVPAGGSTVITVIMSAGRPAALGGHQGSLDITTVGGAPVAHAALYTSIK